MATPEEQAAERRAWDTQREQEAQRKLRREARVRRAKDIIWSAVIATVITLIVFTCAGLADDPSGCREGTGGGRKRTRCSKGKHLHGKIPTAAGCSR